GLPVSLVRDVEMDVHGLVTSASDRGLDLAAFGVTDVAEDDLRALAGERLRFSRPLPTGPTTDQCDFAIELSHVDLPVRPAARASPEEACPARPVDIGRILEHLVGEDDSREGGCRDGAGVDSLVRFSRLRAARPLDDPDRRRLPRSRAPDGAHRRG